MTLSHEVAALPTPAVCDVDSVFEALYTSYYSAILSFLYRIFGDLGTAEDAAQDTYLKAWRALPRLREGSRLKPWLYRIALNTARDRLRRDRLFKWVQWDDLDLEPEGSHFADPQHWYSLAEPLQALGSLREQERLVLALKAHGFSDPEIASMLEITPGAAKMRVARARSALRSACGTPGAVGGANRSGGQVSSEKPRSQPTPREAGKREEARS